MSKLRLNRNVVYTEKPPIPNNMIVELTSACNHACKFCSHKTMERKPTFCDKDKMLDVIKQAYDLGTREIGFYLFGEPFLSKDLEFFVEKCKNMGFEYIYITTNGALAEKERVKKLYESGLSTIKFSVDAGTKETYKKIHGRDDFDTVIKNIKDILDMRNEGMDLPVFASYCKLKSNENEFELFMETIGKYLDDVHVSIGHDQFGLVSEMKDEMLPSPDLFNRKKCDMVFNRLHITSELYLTACCLDANNMLAVADLNKTSLEEAWYSDTFVKLRREHLSGNFSEIMCYNCMNRERIECVYPLVPELSAVNEINI